ncbi:DEAD/DEAH box helicase [Gordonia terrae]|uniref:ATP-dependent helicase n=2 Tax=Gordonia terrae TaxID=2055 RepID=A0AAD0P1B8_9ACTN|nr:DEAD/DEAH box helicase [Gordonia terrae]VTR07037.1 DNA/RNA helicase, superfamily II [Clostridioides difficile]ANY25912.1 RNA helicase [Gordonia terrae]AWO86649.1 ATP-dependent helicase [Gordonia terrae]VTS40297.1 ATP-dependent RNA helicase rhlE [Gordonia terrae]GAB43186.1 putative ATP-dependent RNA helicase [Gordonia terrae NBRC 100016]
MTAVLENPATTTDAAASTPGVSFESLGVPIELVKVLASQGKTDAFPIQKDTLPDTLDGKDVLGRGKTGSGKTLAFSIPLVAGLAEMQVKRYVGAPTGLILAPTRELATQIAAVVEPLAASVGLTVTTVFGGVKQTRQEQAFRRGVDIVVACPGRLEDLMRQGIVRLDEVEITVIDEADHMADLGFLPVVTKILAATPADGQRMLFSATLDNGVDKLAKRFLDNPVLHSVDSAESPVAAMTHHVFEVSSANKQDLVAELASGTGRRILFMRTKHQAKKLAKKLTEAGIPAVDLHGNLSQAQRDRNLAAFGEGDVRVLVATDVAARGVHVDGIELVVHVDPPAEHKAYLHRSGRTARAGSAGDVVTVVLPEQRREVAQLLRKAKIKVTPVSVDATSAAVDELVGERAPRVFAAARAAAEAARGGGAQNGRSQGGRSQGSRRGGRGRGQGGNSSARGENRSAGTGGGRNSAGGDSRGTRGEGRGRPARSDSRSGGSRSAEGRTGGQGRGAGHSRAGDQQRAGSRGQGRRVSRPAGSPTGR